MTDFTLSIDAAVTLSARFGVARSKRTIQRWCEAAWIDCIRLDTEKNAKFLINQASLESYLRDLQKAHVATDTTTPESDVSRHDAGAVATADVPRRDMSRHDEFGAKHETMQPLVSEGISARERELYEVVIKEKDTRIASLENDKHELQEDKKMLREQLGEQRTLHARQMELLLAAERETKSVTKTIMNLVGHIWPGGKGSATAELPVQYGAIINDAPTDITDEAR